MFACITLTVIAMFPLCVKNIQNPLTWRTHTLAHILRCNSKPSRCRLERLRGNERDTGTVRCNECCRRRHCLAIIVECAFAHNVCERTAHGAHHNKLIIVIMITSSIIEHYSVCLCIASPLAGRVKIIIINKFRAKRDSLAADNHRWQCVVFFDGDGDSNNSISSLMLKLIDTGMHAGNRPAENIYVTSYVLTLLTYFVKF